MSNTANQTATTYNGWANYETWNVALWIDNDYPMHIFHGRMVERTAKASARKTAVLNSEIARKGRVQLTHEEARHAIAKRLREQFTRYVPLNGFTPERMASESNAFKCDLTRSELTLVDWNEIADGLLAAQADGAFADL